MRRLPRHLSPILRIPMRTRAVGWAVGGGVYHRILCRGDGGGSASRAARGVA